tara:strand:+ start:517 stop:759 length:243 start_codon:yes stop_codon:yes gene_type:complete
MLRCREIAEVVADAKQLPWWRKPELLMHLTICGACRLYAKQMNMISTTAKKLASKNADPIKEEELTNKILKQSTKTFEQK